MRTRRTLFDSATLEVPTPDKYPWVPETGRTRPLRLWVFRGSDRRLGHRNLVDPSFGPDRCGEKGRSSPPVYRVPCDPDTGEVDEPTPMVRGPVPVSTPRPSLDHIPS